MCVAEMKTKLGTHVEMQTSEIAFIMPVIELNVLSIVIDRQECVVARYN